MARVLVVSTPLLGHLGPLLGIGRALRLAGHQVEVLTGPAQRGLVEQARLGFSPLPAAALAPAGPGGAVSRRPRWVAARREVIERFVLPLRAQADALGSLLGQADGVDVVLSDTAFLGALPLLLGDRTDRRPPVIGVSVTPLSYVSSEAAPFGSGLPHRVGRLARQRNRQVNWLLHHGPLRPIHAALREELRPWGIPRGTVNYFDAAGAFDRTFHLGVPELEYPRAGLPDRVQCVGPVTPFTPLRPRPAWWPEFERLARDRPVVHVTQGTVDNRDLHRLVRPALSALRDREVVVVVTTGRGVDRPETGADTGADAGSQPAGPVAEGRSVVFSTEVLRYADLLPRTDLMITNGGWGGVQQAAVHGVPLIVAGATEEKPEVAARVAWSGLGLDLRTGTPTPARLHRAIGELLDDGRWRERAAAIRSLTLDRPDPLGLIRAAVEEAAEEAAEQAAEQAGAPERVRSSRAAAPAGSVVRARR